MLAELYIPNWYTFIRFTVPVVAATSANNALLVGDSFIGGAPLTEQQCVCRAQVSPSVFSRFDFLHSPGSILEFERYLAIRFR